MAFVQRANVILEVNDDFIDKYLAQGYNQVDKKGNVIKKGLPTSLNDYKLAYNELQKQVKVLEAENKELQDTITKLKAVKTNKSKVNEE